MINPTADYTEQNNEYRRRQAAMNTPAAPPTIKPPMGEIMRQLAKPLPVATRRQGGQTIRYLPWYRVNKRLDEVTGGHWEGRITHMQLTQDRIIITYAVTIHASEGSYTREATGTELLKESLWDKDKQTWVPGEITYGDCSSNAERMAFRRACARLGLELYDR